MGRTYKKDERPKVERFLSLPNSPFLVEKEDMLAAPVEIWTCAEHGTISETGLCCRGMERVPLEPLLEALEEVGILLDFVSKDSFLSHLLLSPKKEEKLKKLLGVVWKGDPSLYELAVSHFLKGPWPPKK